MCLEIIAAWQQIRAAKKIDINITDSKLCDTCNNYAVMMSYSLGTYPSVSTRQQSPNNPNKGSYEPVHGSAPVITGQEKTNPIAMILGFAMALRHSFNLGSETHRVEFSVEKMLNSGIKTADLMQVNVNFPVTSL